jgi:hypothetical protein
VPQTGTAAGTGAHRGAPLHHLLRLQQM